MSVFEKDFELFAAVSTWEGDFGGEEVIYGFLGSGDVLWVEEGRFAIF